MPLRAGASTLARLVDASASEDEFQRDNDALLTPDSAIENAAPARRGKVATNARPGKPSTSSASSRVVKSVSSAAKGKVAAKKPKKKAVSRAVLAERPNPPSDTEEVEELDEYEEEDGDVSLVAPVEKVGKSRVAPRPVAKGTKVAKARPRPRALADAVDEEEDGESILATVPVKKPSQAAAAAAAATKKKGKRKAQPDPEPEPEVDAMDVEPSLLEPTTDANEEPSEIAPLPTTTAAPASRRRAAERSHQPISSTRTARVQPAATTTSSYHRRAGSASESERDPALRRKLGDMTRKFESLDLKYRALRDVSTRDADSNFDKLRKTTEERARAQDDVIANLKKELASQRSSASEAKHDENSELQRLRDDADRLRSERDRARADKDRAVDETGKLQSLLASAQSENKSLSAKLGAMREAAARSSSVSATSAPAANGAMASTAAASAAAARGQPQKAALVGSADAVKDAQMRQLKEDLYSDLTGLIIRGVKKAEKSDDKVEGDWVYDCIQTGRNGTLHFHLSVSSETPGSSYEDAEFGYVPLLDEGRDRELIEILPDYLTEEICFPRSSAAKFYAKVLDCMTKKIVLED